MALIGSITNWGEIQGQINDANGVLTGVISSAELLGGEIVGMRGLKGDKGDTGDTGADGQDGQDGADGHSPVVTASKTGKVTTVYVDGTSIATINDGQDGTDGQDGADGQDGFSPSASVSKTGNKATITITDKDGTTTADVYDGSGGGASAFIAEYGVTTYADVKDAYDEDAIIICTVDDGVNTAICQLAYFDDANDIFYFTQPKSEGFYWSSIAIDDIWDDGSFQFAPNETVTQLRDGLMTALDKQKLDGIASGAEVNVQSDWNEVDSTKNDYIKNKPATMTPSSHTHGNVDNNGSLLSSATIANYDNLVITDYSDQNKLKVGLTFDGSTTDKFLSKKGTWESSTGEANVQSDWDEADSTDDAYIKNKPTIPSKTSDLNNDSGFLSGGGILDMFYPVGSYYETSDGTFDPNVSWGGTWVLETAGQVHVSAGTGYSVSGALTNVSDGGSATTTLTANQLPKITGSISPLAWYSNSASGAFTKGTSNPNLYAPTSGTANRIGTQYFNMSFGNDEAHNNMQPYIVVNRWHRTA